MRGEIDIDLDDLLAVQLADRFLPPTPAIFGRKSKRRSHWLYRVKGAIKTQQFKLPAAPGQKSGDMVVEVRSTGCQTVAPGSVHPSGENVEWDADGEPAEVDGEVLAAAAVALYREVLSQRGMQEAPPTRSRPAIKPLAAVLTRLKSVTFSANRHSACCPAHEDENPSLSISTGDDGRVLVHCHAGCPAESVVAALGLTMADLHPRQTGRRARRSGGVNTGQDGTAVRESHAQRLVGMVLATPGLDIFHYEGEAYVSFPVGDHIETRPLQGTGFRHWLAARSYCQGGVVPNSQCVKSAIETLAGKAMFDSPERPVRVRIAREGKVIYLDLADERWRVVRVDATGWTIINPSECPVRFNRRPGMLALPEPVRGGSVDELRPLLNLRDDDQWVLIKGWLLSAFRPEGPYAVLVACGEAGSCKSTLCKLLRRLVDPNVAAERRLPREERELFIAARNGWVLSYNNIDHFPEQLSDALCSIVNEGGFAARENFADDTECLFSVRRPVILNGITCAAARSDLLDRSIIVNLDRVPDDRRRSEADVLEEFERVQPRVLGALLDAVACAIREVDRVRLPIKPRIADVVTWVTAAAGTLGWPSDRFLDAVQRNRVEAHTEAVESSLLASSVMALAQQGSWEGTAKDLVIALRGTIGEAFTRELPRSPGIMTSQLKKLLPSLRGCGVEIQMPTRPEGHDKRRVIRIRFAAAVPGESLTDTVDAARAVLAARSRGQNIDMARTEPCLCAVARSHRDRGEN